MSNVLIAFGSPSDYERIGTDFPRQDGMKYIISVNSAHRMPKKVSDHALAMPYDAVVAGAGMKNALMDSYFLHCPDAIHVALPVSDSRTRGMSSILSSSEMPPGCPVAMSRMDDLEAAVGFVNYFLERPYFAVRIHGDRGRDSDKVVGDAAKTLEELGVAIVSDNSPHAIDIVAYSECDSLKVFEGRKVLASFSVPLANGRDLDRYLHSLRVNPHAAHTGVADGGNLALYAAKIVGRNNTEVKAAIAERFERSLGKYDPFRELIEV